MVLTTLRPENTWITSRLLSILTANKALYAITLMELHKDLRDRLSWSNHLYLHVTNAVFSKVSQPKSRPITVRLPIRHVLLNTVSNMFWKSCGRTLTVISRGIMTTLNIWTGFIRSLWKEHNSLRLKGSLKCSQWEWPKISFQRLPAQTLWLLLYWQEKCSS